nr:MAG TPA: hypothetical protein [Caudoviricetes sp.]
MIRTRRRYFIPTTTTITIYSKITISLRCYTTAISFNSSKSTTSSL